MGLPSRLARDVMLRGLSGAQQRLAWSLVACMMTRRPVVDADGKRMVIRIERDAMIDLAGQRINNMSAELEHLRADAVMWAPGDSAHGKPLFEVLRYEPGRIRQAGWVVAHVDETIKRRLVELEVCWIPVEQWQETGRACAVALLVRGTALAWYRDDQRAKAARPIEVTPENVAMFSERAAHGSWPVWLRNTLRPSIKDLQHPKRLVSFGISEDDGCAIVRVRRLPLVVDQGGLLTGLKPEKIGPWIGPDAARTPSEGGWRRVYAERQARQTERAEIEKDREDIERDRAQVRRDQLALQQRLADIERRERALAQAAAGKPVETDPAPQPAAQAQVARKIMPPTKFKAPNFSRGR